MRPWVKTACKHQHKKHINAHPATNKAPLHTVGKVFKATVAHTHFHFFPYFSLGSKKINIEVTHNFQS